MIKYKLVLCTDIFPANSSYTFRKDTQNVSSFIDYFMISDEMAYNLSEFKVLENVVNLSDHSPIHIIIDLFSAMIPTCTEPLLAGYNSGTKGKGGIERMPSQTRRLRWDHANLEHYYAASLALTKPLMLDVEAFYSVNVELNNVYLPSHINTYCGCINYEGNNICSCRQSAIALIELSCSRLVSGLTEIANRTIPQLNNSTLKFWWNDELSELKKNAFHSNIKWLEAGKPKSGVLADCMKSDKYAYKLAIRKVKQAETIGITDSLLEYLSQQNKNSFWNVW